MKKDELTTKSGLHALVWKEGKWFVAKSLEVEVASQGKTKKDSLKNLEEALDLYFEDEKLSRPAALEEAELVSLQYA